ncbi:hypothetical protein L345_09304, partial [Ophiophagus hannah]
MAMPDCFQIPLIRQSDLCDTSLCLHLCNLFAQITERFSSCMSIKMLREQPIFTTRAHVFQIDPTTKKNWVPASKQAVTVSYFYDGTRNSYRIISVDGTKVIINSTITPNMTFTKTSQKFGQWADSRANTVFGLGFSSEQQLTKTTSQKCIHLFQKRIKLGEISHTYGLSAVQKWQHMKNAGDQRTSALTPCLDSSFSKLLGVTERNSSFFRSSYSFKQKYGQNMAMWSEDSKDEREEKNQSVLL